MALWEASIEQTCVQAERDAVEVEDEAAVAEYAALAAARADAAAAARAVLTLPEHILPFLQPGRLVRLLAPPGEGVRADVDALNPKPCDTLMGEADGLDPVRLASNGEASTSAAAALGPGLGREDAGAWGAVVNFERVGSAKAGGGGGCGGDAAGGQYVVDVLVNCAPDSVPGRGPRRRVASTHVPTVLGLRLLPALRQGPTLNPALRAVRMQELAATGALRRTSTLNCKPLLSVPTL